MSSSYNLPARYQSYLGGANFFQRQVSSFTDALPGIIRRGLAQTPNVNIADNNSLPDVSGLDKPPVPYLKYGMIGVGTLLLAGLIFGKKRKAA